ncbi:MAG: hypothetical protein GF418_13515 [Chitinivibrionales bacterium]|nr:hypothetical protein [Chitinivibrionales bacterium]MBD3396638.1 hypothetical protein [Chitinivibrionales bacterium]
MSNRRALPRTLRGVIGAVLVVTCTAGVVLGADRPVDVDALARIVVLDGGRQKPLDTYARARLLQLSGRKTVAGTPAIAWLAALLFDPSSADHHKVFLVNNPQVADAIGIPVRKKRRYSYADLFPGAEKLRHLATRAMREKASKRSPFDAEIVRLHYNLHEYMQLTSVFSFMTPFEGFDISDSAVAALLGLDSTRQYATFLDLITRAPALSSAMKEIQAKGGNDLNHSEVALLDIARTMYDMAKSIGNPPIHIVPESSGDRREWLSPWGMINRYRSNVKDDPEFGMLLAAREAYRAGNQEVFEGALASFQASMERRVAGTLELKDPGLELLYNRIDPFARAKILYGLALLVCLVLMAWHRKWLYATALVLSIAALLPHTFGLLARTVIMARPPVTNLYETFVFVAWAAAALGLVLELRQKKSVGLLIAGVSGFALLHIAGRHALEGDTMGMLTAVLDSNFWLATHIITIALGYAGCCAAGVVGHVYLLKRLFAADDREGLDSLARSVYGILVFGLIFTTAGTVLGGMWADQSWGRFWGWDPKENGALLIVLWCAIVLHARAAGMIRHAGLAAGAVMGLVLVMFAWIGVNLLGIGLHSYGFTSSGAAFLLWFVGIETAFLCASLGAIRLQKNRGRNPV